MDASFFKTAIKLNTAIMIIYFYLTLLKSTMSLNGYVYFREAV